MYNCLLVYFELYRSILNLPSPKSILNWTSIVNGEPGFFAEVFKALSTLDPEDKDCCLMFDAMSIRKQVLWDDKTGKFIGNCDMGNELEIEGTNTAATEVLVFMIVSLNGKWKLPVGYFLQNKISSITQAQLVKSALTHSHKSGLKVWGVTCLDWFCKFSGEKKEISLNTFSALLYRSIIFVIAMSNVTLYISLMKRSFAYTTLSSF